MFVIVKGGAGGMRKYDERCRRKKRKEGRGRRKETRKEGRVGGREGELVS